MGGAGGAAKRAGTLICARYLIGICAAAWERDGAAAGREPGAKVGRGRRKVAHGRTCMKHSRWCGPYLPAGHRCWAAPCARVTSTMQAHPSLHRPATGAHCAGPAARHAVLSGHRSPRVAPASVPWAAAAAAPDSPSLPPPAPRGSSTRCRASKQPEQGFFGQADPSGERQHGSCLVCILRQPAAACCPRRLGPPPQT